MHTESYTLQIATPNGTYRNLNQLLDIDYKRGWRHFEVTGPEDECIKRRKDCKYVHLWIKGAAQPASDLIKFGDRVKVRAVPQNQRTGFITVCDVRFYEEALIDGAFVYAATLTSDNWTTFEL